MSDEVPVPADASKVEEVAAGDKPSAEEMTRCAPIFGVLLQPRSSYHTWHSYDGQRYGCVANNCFGVALCDALPLSARTTTSTRTPTSASTRCVMVTSITRTSGVVMVHSWCSWPHPRWTWCHNAGDAERRSAHQDLPQRDREQQAPVPRQDRARCWLWHRHSVHVRRAGGRRVRGWETAVVHRVPHG